MADEDTLFEVFGEFCTFGSQDRALWNNATMDGAKFVKFCRDTGIVGRKVSQTDCDIIFSKVKRKGLRKIDFQEFCDALQLISMKKHPDLADEHAYVKLVQSVNSTEGPVLYGTAPIVDSVVERMTDHTKYTGSHKHRFNDDGSGKGLHGRDSISKGSGHLPTTGNSYSGGAVHDISQILRPGLSGSGTFLNGKHSGSTRSLSLSKEKLSSSKNSMDKLNLTPSDSPKASKISSSSPMGSKNSVYDRLCDHKQYTGSHKHRFNSDGSGRGLYGRDSIAKSHAPGAYRGGDVKEISQILRPNL
eukprot:Nk52_evm2s223 gene=Nk52_evmTU2s223